MRGATKPPACGSRWQVFQSTLPLRGATGCHLQPVCGHLISIHAPLAGSDDEKTRHNQYGNISIHAPLAGSDFPGDIIVHLNKDFNPRSPCGERRNGAKENVAAMIFQSTLPLRGATGALACVAYSVEFQSTLPLRGATLVPNLGISRENFNPRSPCGERRST